MKKKNIFIITLIVVFMSVLGTKCVNAYSGSVEIDKNMIQFSKVEADEKENGVGHFVIDETKAGAGYKLYYQAVSFPDDDYRKYIGGGLTAEQLKELIPSFDEDKWVETTDKSFYIDRAKIKVSNHSTVWARIVKTDNSTIYNYSTYSIGGVMLDGGNSSGNDDETGNNPSTELEDQGYSDIKITASATITNGKGENFNIGNLTTTACVKIEGISFDSSKNYYVTMTHTKVEPEFNKSNLVTLDKNTNLANVSAALEENGELYLWLFEEDATLVGNTGHKLIINGQKVERPQYPTYGSRIIYSGLSKAFSTNIPRKVDGLSGNRARNITIKIGRVTDTNILNKIKNKDANGMVELLNYAKESTAEYTATINSKSNLATANSVDLSGFKDVKGAYYYAYFVMDDEEQTYYPIEDINLLYSIGNGILCNQNENGFEWNIESDKKEDEQKVDDTIAPTKHPKTGEGNIFIIAIICGILSGVALISKKKINKI